MPQSLHANFAHLVFSTKNREPLISGDIASRIHAYMVGIVKDKGAALISINGMPDHVHLLIKSSKNISDADFMKVNATFGTDTGSFGSPFRTQSFGLIDSPD